MPWFWDHGMIKDRIVGEITMMYHACKVRSGLFPTTWGDATIPKPIPTAWFFLHFMRQKWGGVAWQALFTVVRDRKRALKAGWEESKHAVAMAVGYSLSLFQFGSVISYSSCSSRFIFQLLPGASLWRRVRAADLLEGTRVCPWRRDDK
jgi:hypothetical protein